MPNLIKTVFGSRIGEFYDQSYWAVKLRDPERWISEIDGRIHFLGAVYKPYDWTLDLVSTGDIMDIEQLWMFCPKSETSPEGNTAMLPFAKHEAGTAFMFHVTNMQQESRVDHQIIGKVTNRETGECTCFIWDDQMKCMSLPFYTTVNDFASWRDGIAPIGQLSHDVIGLRL